MTVSKDDLLRNRSGVEDFDIPNVGQVKIRALTRAEVLSLAGKEFEPAEMERHMLFYGMVDPALTADEVLAWHSNAPAGEFTGLSERIAEISGLTQTALKDAVKDFRE